MQDPSAPALAQHHADAYEPRKFTEHSRTELHGIEVSDCTRADDSRAIWIGADGINGRWVTPEQALKISRAIAKAATPAKATPTTPDFGASAHHNLWRITMNHRATNDADIYHPGGVRTTVKAVHSKTAQSEPARIELSQLSIGFECTNKLYPETARAIAAALIEAADICDAYEAHQTQAEEHEIALFNLAPGQRAEAEQAAEVPA